jgi:hypothetical protein
MRPKPARGPGVLEQTDLRHKVNGSADMRGTSNVICTRGLGADQTVIACAGVIGGVIGSDRMLVDEIIPGEFWRTMAVSR